MKLHARRRMTELRWRLKKARWTEPESARSTKQRRLRRLASLPIKKRLNARPRKRGNEKRKNGELVRRRWKGRRGLEWKNKERGNKGIDRSDQGHLEEEDLVQLVGRDHLQEATNMFHPLAEVAEEAVEEDLDLVGGLLVTVAAAPVVEVTVVDDMKEGMAEVAEVAAHPPQTVVGLEDTVCGFIIVVH
jgi:hypothetical protein